MQDAKKTVIPTPSRSIVYLTPIRSKTLKGRIYSEHYQKILQFENECELLEGMDDMFDSLGFPQASFMDRKFEQKKAKQIIKKVEDTVDEAMNDLLKEKTTTFVVNVQYRKNATWQGTITWVEQSQTQHFRSALEMLKLMEQANNEGNTEVICWDEEKELVNSHG